MSGEEDYQFGDYTKAAISGIQQLSGSVKLPRKGNDNDDIREQTDEEVLVLLLL